MKKILVSLFVVLLIVVALSFASEPIKEFQSAKEISINLGRVIEGVHVFSTKVLVKGAYVYYSVAYDPDDNLIVGSVSEGPAMIIMIYDEKDGSYTAQLIDMAHDAVLRQEVMNEDRAKIFMFNVLKHLKIQELPI